MPRLFESTLPLGEAELLRVSAFRRFLEDSVASDLPTSRLSSLDPSLLQDLQRFDRREREGDVLSVVEVLAASLRHRKPLLMHLELDHRVLPLTCLPTERMAHCPLGADRLLAMPLDRLHVLHVEPAAEAALVALAGQVDPLVPLGRVAWAFALFGARGTLLPEIAGPVAYRVAPGTDVGEAPLDAPLVETLTRLRRDAANLRVMAGWPGVGRERAIRLLNGLYLQAALITSRTHPAASGEGWSGPH